MSQPLSGRRLVAAVARSRMLHFALIGGGIFLIAPGPKRRIDLSSRSLATLRAAEATRLGRAGLDEQRAREVDARTVEDELLYREALRLQLDRDDPIVRQRLIQKLLLRVEDLGGAARPPGEAERHAYFEAHRDQFRRPERIHFVQVFAARKEALPPLDALAPDARTAPPLGEALPYPREATATAAEITRTLGAALAGALAHAGSGWSEPVRSPLGWHRVRVVERLPGGPATYDEARRDFELDLLLARREQIVGGYLRKLAASYDLRIDGKPLRGYVPTRRIAVRADPSAED
jgi:hypothetical protein